MKRIIVTGAGGFLGARILQQWQGDALESFPKGFLASAGEADVRRFLEEARPEEAYRANVELPVWVAKAARETGAKLVAFSSDQVYAGVTQDGPLPETLELHPANRYGQYKLEAEQRVLDLCPDSVHLRASWMYDLPGYGLPIRGNLPLNLVRAALDGRPVQFSRNDHRGVTYVRAVITNLQKAVELPGGVYNFGSGNAEDMVRTAQQFAEALGVRVDIEPADWSRNLVMDGAKAEASGIVFASTQQGIRQCLRDYGLRTREGENQNA